VPLLQSLLVESSINRILEKLTQFTEETLPEVRCILLMHDPDSGILQPGSCPSLPLMASDPEKRIDIQTDQSTCALAALRKQEVFLSDFSQDLSGANERLLEAQTQGIKAAFSMPILSTKNELLGVFSFYFNRALKEEPQETPLFQTLTALAAVALERYWSQRTTKNIMAELQASQERLNLALQSQKMGVWDWYVQADRLIWDQAIFDIFGVKKTETQGHFGDLEKLVHPEDIEPLLKAIHQVFEQNTTFDHQFRIIRRGEIRYIAAIGYVARDDNGDPMRMTGLNWDVTDKVIANKKLDQERAKAVANSKMASLGEMASGVAHEINNPLTIILNRANQLKSRIYGGEFEKEWALGELVKIENTVERIAKIIRGLRAFSRNADNDPMIHCELNPIIDETLELCLEKFKRYGVDFRIKGINHILSLNCRPSQISQVLLNLFNNSFDAIVNTTEPWIELEVSVQKGLIRMRVTDSGHGVPSHIADRMMDPFFSTKEVGRGTGLGLSISKGIIEEHGGRLWLDREQLHTSFVIEVPLDEN
jgi:PAS domain S-box-containing protein